MFDVGPAFLIYVAVMGLVLWLFGRLLRLLVRGRR